MQQSIYSVYLTTNRVNDKIYVGVHKTTVPYDDYLGSGSQITRAIKKYGIENFDKQIIAVFDNAKSAYMFESKIVTQEFVDSKITYNMKLGGYGGWDNIGNHYSRNKGGVVTKNKMVGIFNYDRSKAGFLGATKRNLLYGNAMLDKSVSKRSRDTFRERGHQQGTKNSQYGLIVHYITNGVINKRVLKSLDIPEGWIKGRCKVGGPPEN